MKTSTMAYYRENTESKHSDDTAVVTDFQMKKQASEVRHEEEDLVLWTSVMQ